MLKWLRIPKKPFTLRWDMEGECPWRKWHKFAKRRYPVRYFLSESLPHFWEYTIRWKMRDWYYGIKNWFFPWNVVKIKTLPRSWCDNDTRLLHLCFLMLTDWVEKEEPYEFHSTREEYIKSYTWDGKVDWERVKGRDTLHELYAWWKSYQDTDDGDYELEQQKLHTLIRLRGHLWT